MYATAEPGDSWRRSLDDDDRAAMRYLYGDRPTEVRRPGLGCDTGGGGGGAPAGLALACLSGTCLGAASRGLGCCGWDGCWGGCCGWGGWRPGWRRRPPGSGTPAFNGTQRV